jgi:hypothetical protein
MTHTTLWRPSMRSAIRSIALGVMCLAGSVSCDTKVTNPGPVTDAYISDRNASSALVLGAGRALSQGMNWISYTGAAVTREIHPAGSTGSFGITGSWQLGHLADNDPDLDVHWEQMQRARWLAEEAIRRLTAPTMGPPPAGSLQTPAQYYLLLQQAYVYAGYANKLLGENFCFSVIDGGPEGASSVYLTRAEQAFTDAMAVNFTGVTMTAAQTTTMQQMNAYALAGRAATRVDLGNWATADADAAAELALTTTGTGAALLYNMPYYTTDDAIRNRIFWSSGNTRESGSAYRAHTQWNTWYMQYKYGSSTASPGTQVIVDPRITVAATTLLGDAAIDCCGKVPFFPEAKHNLLSSSPIKLVNGREMMLIRAENELLKGAAANVVTALGFINQARTNAGAATITTTDVSCATNCPDMWRLLKRERGIELWLEARRLGDFRRWKAKGAADYGAYDPLEVPPVAGTPSPYNPSHLQVQDVCFPVALSEKRTNPNNIP